MLPFALLLQTEQLLQINTSVMAENTVIQANLQFNFYVDVL